MESIKNMASELDRMIAEKATTVELASLFGRVWSMGTSQMAILAMMCRNSRSFLEIERAREWPEEHAAALGGFIRNLPCVPISESYPCGKKELFIAEALEDTAVPKIVRIHLWHSLVMDGYKFPCYIKGREWTNVPRSLYDHPAVRKWLCLTKQDGWEDIRLSDPLFFGDEISRLFKKQADEKALEAIEKDSPSALLMPLAIAGKLIPAKYFLAALEKRSIRIISYIVCNGKALNRLSWLPKILFYVCANWNDDNAISIVKLLEKEKPGLVRNSLDAFGHDALWYTLYQRDRFNRATPAARRKMTPLDRTLIKLGCDPKRQNDIGLSYDDLTVSE